MEPNTETALGLLLALIGVACITYEYSPVYGSTPLAVGLGAVGISTLWTRLQRKARS